MASSTPTIFVTSATGTVGEAVARQARGLNWSVKATTRNLESPVARSLKAIDVNIALGDWDNESVLKQQLTACTYLFLNMMPSLSNISAEAQQAERILTIAKASGVKHVVYSSGMGITALDELGVAPDAVNSSSGPAPRPLFVAALLSKAKIEQLVRTAGFDSWTLLRPGNFMANFLEPKVQMYAGLVADNVWTTALLPTTKLPMIDHEDIARFALAALQDPGRFRGREIALASELKTPGELLGMLGPVVGRPLRVRFMNDEEVEAQKGANPFIAMQLLMRNMQEFADVEGVKEWALNMNTFAGFLEREKEALKRTFPPQ